MGRRLVFVGMGLLALSSASFGLHIAVGQDNAAGHSGPGNSTNSNASALSPDSGIYVLGSQTATSVGTGGFGTVVQAECADVWEWTSHKSDKQYVSGSLAQSAVQIWGPGVSSGSQVGHVHMIQTNDKPPGGITKQVTHIVGIQAQDVWTNPCGFATSTQEAIVKRAEQMQRKSLP